MTERKTIATRKAFASAVTAGKSRDEVMRTIRIARSTYYKWYNALRRYKEAWAISKQRTRAICISGSTVEWTHKRILEQSLLHPALGPKQLSSTLARPPDTLIISASAIHNILKKRGLGDRKLRVAELHRRFLAGVQLTRVQERLVETIHPTVRWKGEKGRRAGEVLIQETIDLHQSSPLAPATVSIVVDTFDGRAFAHFFDNSDKSQAAITCASEAIEYCRKRGQSTHCIYTDGGHEFGGRHRNHSYNECLKRFRIVHRLIPQPENKWNPYAEEIWRDLQKFVFGGGVRNPESYRDRLHELNLVIREFLDQKIHH